MLATNNNQIRKQRQEIIAYGRSGAAIKARAGPR
jgi:hypothetical protein